MTTPVNPSQNPSDIPPETPSNTPPTSPSGMPTSWEDPTGAWASFLSTPGNPASAEEVQMFINGLLKFFNVMIQQQTSVMQQANQQLKEVAEGEE